MHQTRVVFFIAAVGPHNLLLDKREDALDLQEKLGNSDIATESRRGGTLHGSERFHVVCDVGRSSTEKQNTVLELERLRIVQQGLHLVYEPSIKP